MTSSRRQLLTGALRAAGAVTAVAASSALAPLAWMNALDFTFTGAGTVGAVGMANNIALSKSWRSMAATEV